MRHLSGTGGACAAPWPAAAPTTSSAVTSRWKTFTFTVVPVPSPGREAAAEGRPHGAHASDKTSIQTSKDANSDDEDKKTRSGRTIRSPSPSTWTKRRRCWCRATASTSARQRRASKALFQKAALTFRLAAAGRPSSCSCCSCPGCRDRVPVPDRGEGDEHPTEKVSFATRGWRSSTAGAERVARLVARRVPFEKTKRPLR